MDSLGSVRVSGVRRATGRRWLLLVLGLTICLSPLPFAAAQETPKPPNSPLAQGEFTAELSGLRLWFKVSGTGPVCLMPTPAWGPSSDLYFRTLKPLEKIFTIVYLDSRGTGRSQKAASTKEYTWDHLVADLEALRAHLKQEKVWLMGHSEGGMQVLHYACKYPQHTNGLVLLDTIGVRDQLQNMDLEARIMRRRDQPWFAEATEAASRPTPTDDQMQAAMKTQMPFFFADPAKIANHEADFAATTMSAVAKQGQSDSQRDKMFDLRDPLTQLKAPALIVVGSDDSVCSPFAAQRLHLALPNSKLLLIENAGHFPWLEQPERFFTDVPMFLQALNATDRRGP